MNLSFALSLLLLAGCDTRQSETPETTGDRLQKEATNAVDAAADFAQTAAADLKAKLTDQAAKLNARLAALKEEAKEGSAALVEQTQQKLEAVKAALSRLDSATADERERIKEETTRLLKELEAWWAEEK